jgi:ABC-type oligopeptide transport system substrate-binding subunit
VQIKAFPVDTMFARDARPGEPFDIAFYGWQANYPDPVEMLTRMLADSTLYPTFNGPAYQRKLAATAQLTGPERYLAYGKLDIALARNAAPLIAFGNASSSDFFSARIGCQTYGPFGIDFAALCIKPKTH